MSNWTASAEWTLNVQQNTTAHTAKRRSQATVDKKPNTLNEMCENWQILTLNTLQISTITNEARNSDQVDYRIRALTNVVLLYYLSQFN